MMTTKPNELAQTPDFEFASLNEARNYRDSLLRDFRSYLRGNVLEIGAGIGHFTSKLRAMPEIQKLTSIEPDPGFCARLLAQFPEHDLVEGTVNDLKADVDWDAILSINVLEHIETDLEELARYHALLQARRGTLCLFVPARPEIYAPIDKDFGHFRRYTRQELRCKLEEAGFRLLHFRYYNFVGYFLWWVNFCILKKRTFEVAKVKAFDRAIFPLVDFLESHIWVPPIGQSLIAIAEAR